MDAEEVREWLIHYRILHCNDYLELDMLREFAEHFRSAVGGVATDATAIRDAVQNVIKMWRVAVKSTWPPEPGQVFGTKVWCDEAKKAVNSFADALDRSLKSTQQSPDAGRGGKS
jgi:hypothetical protein